MFRSALIRLTAWYLVIIVAISVVFSAVLYQVLTHELDAGFRRQSVVLRNPAASRPVGDLDDFERLRGEQLDQTKHRIIDNLLLLNLAILVLGAGASYLLARRTLHPIRDAMDAQSRFTADASHELRTPLAAMRAETEVALRGKRLDRKDVRQLLASNLEEIGKLEALSAALLKLAEYGNGIPPDAAKPVTVRELLTEAKRRVAALAKRQKVTIAVPTASAAGQSVAGDRQSLVELFVILFDNAIKYGRAGMAVTVTTAVSGNHVVIAVEDRGIGIKASDVPRVFDRFYRADVSRSGRNVAGYGLGLSLAKQIVEVHHGKIELASAPDRGTTVTVTLPAASAVPAQRRVSAPRA